MNKTTALLLTFTLISGYVNAMEPVHTNPALPPSVAGHHARVHHVPAHTTRTTNPPVIIDDTIERTTRTTENPVTIVIPANEITTTPITTETITTQQATTITTTENPVTTVIQTGAPAVTPEQPSRFAQVKNTVTTAALSAKAFTQEKTALLGSALGSWICLHPLWNRILTSPSWNNPLISVSPDGRLARLNKFTRLHAVEAVSAAAVLYGLYKATKYAYDQYNEEDVFAN